MSSATSDRPEARHLSPARRGASAGDAGSSGALIRLASDLLAGGTHSASLAHAMATQSSSRHGRLQFADEAAEDAAALLAAFDVAEQVDEPARAAVAVAARIAPSRAEASRRLRAARASGRTLRRAAVLMVVAGLLLRLLLGDPLVPEHTGAVVMGVSLVALAMAWLGMATSVPFTLRPWVWWRRRHDARLIVDAADRTSRAAMLTSMGVGFDEAVARSHADRAYLASRGCLQARERVARGTTPTDALVEITCELWDGLAELVSGQLRSGRPPAGPLLVLAGAMALLLALA